MTYLLSPLMNTSFNPSQSTLAPCLPSAIASLDELNVGASASTVVINQNATVPTDTSRPEGSPRSAKRPQPVRRGHSPSTSPGSRYAVADGAISRILETVKKTLPVYSGLTLNDLAHDPRMIGIIQFACSLAVPQTFPSSHHASSPTSPVHPHSSLPFLSTPYINKTPTPSGTGAVNLIARGLCELLENVNKLQGHASPVQILHSQVFLLQSLLRFLTARTPEPPVPESVMVPVQVSQPVTDSVSEPKDGVRGRASAPVLPSLGSTPSASATRPPSLPTHPSVPTATSDLFTLHISTSTATASVSAPTASLHPAVTSYMLSVLLPFVACRTRDIIGYPNTETIAAPPPAGPRRHSTPFHQFRSQPRSPTSKAQRPNSPKRVHHVLGLGSGAQTHVPPNLTPFPSIPLHGFEVFASPDAVGVLCPAVVWEHSTDMGLHPAKSSSRSPPGVPPRHSPPGEHGTHLRPYTSLYKHLDTYPPALCFLPSDVLLGRYAARCVYFLSRAEQCEREYVRGGDGKDWVGEDVVWGRILKGIARLADTRDNHGTEGNVDWRAWNGGVGGATQKEKQKGSRQGVDLGLASMIHRRGNTFPFSLPGIHAPGEGGDVVVTAPDVDDATELRMLGFVAMSRARLGVIVREMASLFLNMSLPAQGAAAAAIRTAVFVWIEDAPAEFVGLAGGNSSIYLGHGGSQDLKRFPVEHIDGAEKLLDLMLGLAKAYSTTEDEAYVTSGGAVDGAGSVAAKQNQIRTGIQIGAKGVPNIASRPARAVRALLWAAVGALWCVCTERVRRAEVGRGNGFLAQLARFTRAPGANADIALRVWTDICRAAFFIPPCGWPSDNVQGGKGKDHRSGEDEEHLRDDDVGECPLRAVAGDVVDELACFLERYPPYAAQAIDVDLYTDALVAIYRYAPQRAAMLIRAWIAPSAGAAVKLCVLRAALTLIVEAGAFPWQSDLGVFVESCTSGINALFQTLLRNADEDTPLLPLSLHHPEQKTLRRTLLLTLQGLLRLDLSFVLSSVSVADLKEVSPGGAWYNVTRFPTLRDEGTIMMGVAMYAAWIAGARHVCREGATMRKEAVEPPLYKQACEYLRAGVLTTLFACAQEVVHVWSNTENVLCVHAVGYILKSLTDSIEDGEDISWRYSEARFPALAMTEIALLTAYKSAQSTISRTAIDSFLLLTQALEDPKAPPPQYLARSQEPAQSALFGAITPVQGQVAVQKHAREVVSATPPCSTHLAAWRESHWRWTILSPVVIAPEDAVEPQPGLEIGPVTYKERQTEWANVVLALARGSAACLNRIDVAFFDILGTHLPDRMSLHHEPRKLVGKFVEQLVDMLSVETFHVQETAKQALGNELDLKVVSFLFEYLNTVVPERLKNVSVVSAPDKHVVLFVKNCVDVLSLLVARVGDDTTLPAFDVGPLLLSLARFLNLPISTPSDLLTRAHFCNVIQLFVNRRDIFTFREGSSIRQSLLDSIMSWTDVVPFTTLTSGTQSMPDYVRSLQGCRAAALRTACGLAENLQLQPLESTTNMDTPNVVSRLFHRYMMAFVKCLDLEKRVEDNTSSRSDSVLASQSSRVAAPDEGHIHDHVISGIAHLVNSNMDVWFKHCIGFGYHDEARLRAVFMEVFSQVLKRGTRFDTRDTLKPGSKASQLCELVRYSESLVDAIVTVCPTTDVELLISVLLNIFDTRQAMLALAQRLVLREIQEAAPTALFREYNLINELLSALIHQHGHSYLRTILVPLLEEMAFDMLEDETRSFELDPAKLHLGETLAINCGLVARFAQSLIDCVIASAARLPSIVVDICHYISTTVNQKLPQSRYTAVGGFFFLRFLCPALVSPESIDLQISCRDSQTRSKIRRGLVVLAKILQSLSNNKTFGKEAYMVCLNPLLESNIGPMSKFLEETFVAPSSDQKVDQWLGMTYDDTDTMVLHQFFHQHRNHIGAVLLTGSASLDDSEVGELSATWTQLCAILLDLGPALQPPVPTVALATDDPIFQGYMQQNAHRNRDPVRNIFFPCKDRPDVYVLRLQALNIQIMDLHLLMYHLCYTLCEYSSPIGCKFVLDYTKYNSTAELPVDWLKLCVEFIPVDLRQKIHAMYYLNANALTQRYLRKFFLVSQESNLAKEVRAFASVSELFEHIGHVESIREGSTGLLEAEPCQVFQNVYQRYVHHKRAAVALEVRTSHLRITSLKSQVITPRMWCKTVEIVPLEEVDDIYRIASETDCDLDEFVIARYRNGTALQFSSCERSSIIQAIRTAKARADSYGRHTIDQFSGMSDISATLLAIGLVNTCHDLEWPRGAANILLIAICSYLKYETISTVLPAKSTSVILNPSTALVLFSERLAAFAPHLTLDFLIELRLGLNKAPTVQKMACMTYLPPWIRNLSRFTTPGDTLYDQSGTKLGDAIHSLCDISLRNEDLFQHSKQCVWIELSKLDDITCSVVINELIRVAVDSGIDSGLCERVADVIMTLSSIHVRSRIIARLRQTLRKQIPSTVTNDICDPPWSELSTLARLALAASYNPRAPVQNQLFIPETTHIITMLAAAGPLALRRSIYAMVLNLFHALSTTQNRHETSTLEYRSMTAGISSPFPPSLFGLSLTQSGMAYVLERNSSEHVEITEVEDISKLLLLRVIEAGDRTPGLVNVLKARWMSLVTATAFQAFPSMQARAFTVLGVLISDSKFDDEYFFQILVALKNAIRLSPDGDCVAVLSMLRCMRKLIPGLLNFSVYQLCDVFWLAVALLQTSHIPYYVESMQLIRAVLDKLEAERAFVNSNVPSVLLLARSKLVNELAGFDEISGFSFTDELSFSLSIAYLLYAIAQHQKLRHIATDVIRGCLCVISRNAQLGSDVRMENREADPSLVGFILVSLPFCTTVASLRALLEDANVDIAYWESHGLFTHDGYKSAVPFSLFGAYDTRSTQLIIAFLVSMIELHAGDIPEKEILFTLLADANEAHPVIVAETQCHYLTFSRANWIGGYAFSGHTTMPILAGMGKVIKSLLTFEDQWDLVDPSTSCDGSPTPHYLMLQELRMSGLATHLHSYHKDLKDFALFSHLFGAFFDRILDPRCINEK